MKLTIMVCENGWTALYVDGKRYGTFQPDSGFAAHMVRDPEVVVVNVPSDPGFKDFPATVA